MTEAMVNRNRDPHQAMEKAGASPKVTQVRKHTYGDPYWAVTEVENHPKVK